MPPLCLATAFVSAPRPPSLSCSPVQISGAVVATIPATNHSPNQATDCAAAFLFGLHLPSLSLLSILATTLPFFLNPSPSAAAGQHYCLVDGIAFVADRTSIATGAPRPHAGPPPLGSRRRSEPPGVVSSTASGRRPLHRRCCPLSCRANPGFCPSKHRSSSKSSPKFLVGLSKDQIDWHARVSSQNLGPVLELSKIDSQKSKLRLTSSCSKIRRVAILKYYM
ncbi:uncharacterized protein LOC107303520 [Oryza brachyantha]|uniref:uncharacterized protein LOC107303520 n=1 Tax=Oryza brachyantha TaxID=4533 RepID=UPI0007763CEE|nr:uncharacterized protein LOC107303520 [Oryza brachyantha]